tara:strand:+ start:154 stop:573 length:420 start_codon:yes stop_codon:yes gene_type:complete
MNRGKRIFNHFNKFDLPAKGSASPPRRRHIILDHTLKYYLGKFRRAVREQGDATNNDNAAKDILIFIQKKWEVAEGDKTMFYIELAEITDQTKDAITTHLDDLVGRNKLRLKQPQPTRVGGKKQEIKLANELARKFKKQ